MAKVKEILSREIINSLGNPTIETTVVLSDNAIGISSFPVGEECGPYEALTLYDKDENRFKGLGMQKAISNIQTIIAPKIINMDATKQQVIDRAMIELDGTQNKGRLGANAIFSVSMAIAKAAAKSSVLPLYLYLRQYVSSKDTPPKIPIPLIAVANGGYEDVKNIDFKNFFIIPASFMPFHQALEASIKIYKSLETIIKSNNSVTSLVGKNGGFCPQVENNNGVLSLISQAITSANFRIGFDIFIGLDANAQYFYKGQQYKISDRESSLSSKSLSSFYEGVAKQYNLLYIEDPLGDDDWDGHSELTKLLSKQLIIAGDASIATNLYRLQMAIDKKSITGIVVKPAQVGTVIEALAVVEVAKAAGLKIIVSERTEETNDSFIADFAVGVGADYVKCGAPVRGERVGKYNRLLEIESQLKQL